MSDQRSTQDGPWCWQSKPARRKIREAFDATRNAGSALSAYDALTEIASDSGADEFTTTHAWIAHLSGLSPRTVGQVVKGLAEIGLLYVSTPKLRAPCVYRLLSVKQPLQNDPQPLPSVRQRTISPSLPTSEERKESQKKVAQRFAAPTLSDWVAYADELQWLRSDAEAAFDHYVANGWVQGRGKPIPRLESRCAQLPATQRHHIRPRSTRCSAENDPMNALAAAPSPDLAHEQRLVAVLFTDEGVSLQKALAAGLTPSHFTDPVSRTLFEVACDLLRHQRPVAQYAAGTWLRDHGELAAVGGYSGLAELLSWKGTSAPFASDLQRTLAASALRRVAHHAEAALALAVSPIAGDLASRFDAILPHLRAAQEAGNPTTVRDLKAIAEAAACELESTKPRGVSGPFISWDRDAGALRPGELVVLAARPGVGKTALALQHATACNGSGRPCVMFSLEMTGEELCGRLARQALGAHATNRDLAAWIRAKLPGNGALSIYDGASGATLAQIESRCRLHAAHPRGLGLVVIDYLQLITPSADLRRENRERQVATITRSLKLLANELRVPVLLLAQLNRESEKEDRRPRLTDLRESGAIEQDADAVWFLHPDTSGPKISNAERVPVLLIQAKRRSGPPDVALRLTFNRPAVTFGAVE